MFSNDESLCTDCSRLSVSGSELAILRISLIGERNVKSVLMSAEPTEESVSVEDIVSVRLW